MSLFDTIVAALPAAEAPAVKPAALAERVVVEEGLTRVAGEIDVEALVSRPRGAPVGWSKDLDRILKLPRRELDTRGPSAAEKWTRILRREEQPEKCDCVARWGFCITHLKPIQGWALEEMHQSKGLLGPIGVGHGKEGTCLLAAWALGVKRALLLIPANLRAQFLTRDYPQWSVHFKVPSLAGVRVYPGAPVLTVMSFNDLSRPERTAALKQIQPQAVIVNESQNLARPEAARTKRFLRYMRGVAFKRPDGSSYSPHLVAVSGTMTKTSIKDYAHLSELALGEGTPLPTHHPTIEEWAAAIDASDRPAPMGKLRELCRPGETVRQGFRRRLVQTPGVVATEESALDTLLTIAERKLDVPPVVAKLLAEVRETWQRPDGEELVEVIQKAKVCKELACGFYYVWTYPRGEPEEVRDAWLAARKEWNKEVREKLKYSREGLDSPLLVRNAAYRWHNGYWHVEAPLHEHGPQCYPEGDDWKPNFDAPVKCGHEEDGGRRTWIPPRTRNGPRPTWESLTYARWMEVKDTVAPQTKAIWVDDYLVRDAAEWARRNKGIVWYESSVVGERIAELAGVPLYGGGEEASATIIHERGDRSIVASTRAHGTGKNLQVFAHNLYPQPMTDGAAWEQNLARTHRPGQRADEVTATVYRHTVEMRQAIDTAIARARYIRDTMGGDQKLLYATIEFEDSLTPED